MRIWYDELQNCMNAQFCLDQAESLNEQMCALPKYALMQMLSIDKFINRKTQTNYKIAHMRKFVTYTCICERRTWMQTNKQSVNCRNTQFC